MPAGAPCGAPAGGPRPQSTPTKPMWRACSLRTTALFRDGDLSLVRAAHVAEMDVASFIAHLGRLGIAAIRLTAAETNTDLDTLDQWLQSSSPTPVR